MQMKKLCLVILCVVTLGVNNCYSQRRNDLGFVGGGSYYLGELNPGMQFANVHTSFGAYYRRNFGQRLSARLTANYASISGDDTKKSIFGKELGYAPREGVFNSNLIDVSATLEINFLNYFIGASRYFWTPYMILGAGGTYQLSLSGSFVGENPSLGYSYVINNDNITQQKQSSSDTTAIIIMTKPSKITPNLNFGFGFKYSVSDRIGLFAEWVMHKTFIDWLDGFYFDKHYSAVNPASWPEDEIEKRIDYAHICDTSTKDWYSFFQLGICFAFNLSNKNDCYDHLRK